MRVAALYIYPVKACRALALGEARLGPLGLEHDRRFAFVGEDGRALTQREHPLLATVRPALDRETLRLDLGGLAELAIEPGDFVAATQVDVWGNAVPGRAAPPRITMPVAEYLGTVVRLVALDPAAPRSFADARPVLVASTGMLAALNARLDVRVGMERFRPNVVVESEGCWRTLRSDDVVLEIDKPCGRCEVTTIDQASGEPRGPEPLQTIAERFAGNFGDYYRVARPGTLRRGEALRAS